MTMNPFLDNFQTDLDSVITDLDNVIDELKFIKVRSDLIDPIMSQQISSSLDTDASDFERLEESMRKSQEVPDSLEQSSEMIDDSLAKLDNSLAKLERTDQAIAKLKDDLKAEKEKMRRLIDAS